ncbi:hypothetical protein PHLCEN_2v8623 [Hermanssonia centrifuga]|uniref:Uncharacterized protein n=1 Tax=Hermanssonia centrifuga TaxID=98765 RepID=A0A2R6NT89_9APHY|nr:hypothetical protein PHLCEN_2v8623 [Hermanssonia centrifuga]
MALSLPPNFHPLSSIPAPSQHPGPDAETAAKLQDPLDGSLGLYLFMSFLVLILVLGVATIVWRVHLHSRPVARFQVTRSMPNDSDLYLPSFRPSSSESSTTKSEFMLSPNLSSIRAPIQRLKALRSSPPSNTPPTHSIPNWTVSGTAAAPVVPSIVISCCSPVIVSNDPVFPTTASTDSLQVPGCGLWKAPRPKTPLVQLDGLPSNGDALSQAMQVLVDRQPPPRVLPKKPQHGKRSGRAARKGKENAPPNQENSTNKPHVESHK